MYAFKYINIMIANQRLCFLAYNFLTLPCLDLALLVILMDLKLIALRIQTCPILGELGW